MTSIEAIKKPVANGKHEMFAFAGHWTEHTIDDIAAYVLEQAENVW